MRTSLNDIKMIEAYLCNTLSTGDRLLFESHMLLSKELRQNVASQRKIYAIIQHHYRTTLKQKFNMLHDRLLHDPLREITNQQIIKLFKH